MPCINLLNNRGGRQTWSFDFWFFDPIIDIPYLQIFSQTILVKNFSQQNFVTNFKTQN